MARCCLDCISGVQNADRETAADSIASRYEPDGSISADLPHTSGSIQDAQLEFKHFHSNRQPPSQRVLAKLFRQRLLLVTGETSITLRPNRSETLGSTDADRLGNA